MSARKRPNEGEERRLAHFPSAYPGGSAGFALLLLRAVIGLTAFQQSWEFLARSEGTRIEFAALALLLLLSGLGILLGVRTRSSCVFLCLTMIAAAVVSRPLPGVGRVEPYMLLILGETTIIALILLGPGAFSLDSRKFGRREIIISHDQK